MVRWGGGIGGRGRSSQVPMERRRSSNPACLHPFNTGYLLLRYSGNLGVKGVSYRGSTGNAGRFRPGNSLGARTQTRRQYCPAVSTVLSGAQVQTYGRAGGKCLSGSGAPCTSRDSGRGHKCGNGCYKCGNGCYLQHRYSCTTASVLK